MNPGIIIQSRLGSTRLPRKAFLLLGGKTVIEHCVDRCLETGLPVVLAVPEGEGQEYKTVIGNRCPVYEGHPTDVLDRYYEVAKAFQFDPIVRITGDCPLVDFNMIKAMVKIFRSDYLSNCHPIRTVPEGMDIEVMSFFILESIWKRSKSLKDEEKANSYKEHVTQFIYEQYSEDCETYVPPFPDSWKLCIDSQEDYEQIKAMIEEGKFPWLN